VAVISEGLWQRRYDRDPAVLGKPFETSNGTFTIVGAPPGDFDLPQGSDAWVTFAAINPDLLAEDAYAVLDLVGRLRPRRTAEEVAASSIGSWRKWRAINGAHLGEAYVRVDPVGWATYPLRASCHVCMMFII
jgi:hypothetical protein